MTPTDKKTKKTKSSSQSDVKDWLKKETPEVRRSLERASRHFDKHDAMDVHTLEAVYAKESTFGKKRGTRNSDYPAGDFQIDKATAMRFGLQVSENNDERFDIGASAAAAAKVLKNSDDLFRNGGKIDNRLKAIAISNAAEREKFDLSAYHAGDSRIAAAQRLALADGKDPTQWENVEKYLEKARAKPNLADETRQYVKQVPDIESQFKKQSNADSNAKYKKGLPVDPYPDGGHWITKDGRHVFIRD